MKRSLPLSHVAELVAEHMYNMSIPEQTEILKHNFGVEVEDTDDGVLWEGVLITDSKFDQYYMEIIENMSGDSIMGIWEDCINAICELDEDNNVVWEDDGESES